MGHDDAVRILAANAACGLLCGCNSCPVYKDFVDSGRQEGFCSQYTSYERVKEAVQYIYRTTAQ